MAVGDVAQRSAAHHIGAVDKGLHRYPGPLADGLEDGPGNPVGGVFLAGVVFDDDAFVDKDLVGGVGEFGMVGMYRMGVVSGEHHAGSDGGVVLLLRLSQSQGDAAQHIVKQGGIGALFGGAAYLLVVKDTAQRDAMQGFDVAAQKRLQGGVGAFQVIQLGRGDILPIFAPNGAGHPVVEEQVGVQNLLLLYPGGAGDLCKESAGSFPIPVQGKHIHLRIVFYPVVGLAVHMDGHIGDEHHIPIHLHQPGGNPIAGAHHNPSGYRQRAVHPGGAEHSAIHLGIELGIVSPHRDFRVGFDLKGRGIAVAGDNLKSGPVLGGGKHEGDDGGKVAGYIVFFSRP